MCRSKEISQVHRTRESAVVNSPVQVLFILLPDSISGYGNEWQGDRWTVNWDVREMKSSWPNLSYYLGIYQSKRRRVMEYLWVLGVTARFEKASSK